MAIIRSSQEVTTADMDSVSELNRVEQGALKGYMMWEQGERDEAKIVMLHALLGSQYLKVISSRGRDL